ncbi:MAG TPA: DUF4384 domain-containing protein [Bryobacterales bacterium]|nr:DUF4384 domain-containing protein [Bryobacterales bacterium]
MSARDMFRNASRLFGKEQPAGAKSSGAGKTSTSSTTKSTPTPEPEPQPDHPIVAENRDERPKTVPDEGEAQLINAALEPEENPLGLRYSFLKQQGNGTVEVDTATEFRSGERIRLTVESNDSAYLYLVLLGSSGKWSVLFPSSQIAGGNNHIEPGHRYTIPAQHWFAFDDQVGEEKLFILLSRQPQEDLEELIYSLQTAPGAQSPAEPAKTPGGEKLLMAQALPVDDALIGRLREEVYARDLVFEKVDDTEAAGSQGEKAVYIVNRTGSDDSRVVADVTLVHR